MVLLSSYYNKLNWVGLKPVQFREPNLRMGKELNYWKKNFIHYITGKWCLYNNYLGILNEGLFTWRWGTLGRWGTLPQWGNQSLHTISFFSWLRSHERWGTPLRWVAQSAGPGNRLSWGEFPPCESWRWCNPPSWGEVHLGIYQHGCQPLQAWQAFLTISSSKCGEKHFQWTNYWRSDGPSDNLSMESNNKAELLKYLKEYKVTENTCDFNEKDFEQDLSAMYTEIRRCLVIDCFDEFGLKSTTQLEKPLNEKNGEEY